MRIIIYILIVLFTVTSCTSRAKELSEIICDCNNSSSNLEEASECISGIEKEMLDLSEEEEKELGNFLKEC